MSSDGDASIRRDAIVNGADEGTTIEPCDAAASNGCRRPRPITNRLESLSKEASHLKNSSLLTHGGATYTSWWGFTCLAFQSIGVVFGDVGTSPLYVFSSTFTPAFPPTHDRILGALSLIFWTILLLPLVKYTIVMQANDHGNGGTFALYSLICRHARVSQLPHHHADDDNHDRAQQDLSVYTKIASNGTSTPGRSYNRVRQDRATAIKGFLERSAFAKHLLLVLTLLGTCSVIGDGTLTPAISVLSAVDGLQGLFPSLSTDAVAGISVVILLLLFSCQRFGTAKVGGFFAPIVLLWFSSIFMVGIFNIVKHAESWYKLLLAVVDPRHIFWYFQDGGKAAWVSLGGIVLCITGTEAMFADLGHFSSASIQAALRFVVAPSLLAAYIGQGAYLIKFPEDVSRTFYKSIPSPVYIPVFIVAVAAAVIASQAMISATFSIIQQSHALGCFPHVKVVHTSSHVSGQVYVPEINWILMTLCISITGGFKTTTLIGNAYGIVVIAVMFISTCLLSLIMLLIWQTPIYLVIPFALVFSSLELMYFSSNLYKFIEGGFIPVAFASVLLVIMLVWHYVSTKKYQYEASHTVPTEEILHIMRSTQENHGVVQGVGLIYTHQIKGMPPIYMHYLDNVHAMHAVVVLVTIKVLPVAHVPEEERFLVRKVGEIEDPNGLPVHVMYRCVARYGYLEGSRREKKETKADKKVGFEEALMNSLKKFIVSQSKRNDFVPGEGNANEDQVEDVNRDGRVVEIVIDMNGGPDIFRTSSELEAITNDEHQMELVSEEEIALAEAAKKEIERLEACQRKGGITYLLGHTDVKAAPNATWPKKVVVNVLYDIIHRACRHSYLSQLAIPTCHRLLKVGMVYEI